MIEIKAYASSDYEEIKQNLQEGGLFEDVWDRKENLDRMTAMNAEAILVAVENGAVIGSIYIGTFGWEAFIFRLAVRKSHRNKGIGTQLLEEAEKRLRQQGTKEVAFFVDAEDKELQEFYRKRGYSTEEKLYVSMWREL